MRLHLIMGMVVSAGVAWAGDASAAGLTPEYLEGRWTTGAVENCAKPEHEQTVFRRDGTFATEQGGQALAVGFWQGQDDKIDMEILTTEASLSGALRDQLPGDYHVLYVTGLVFDITENGFRMVQGIQGELRGVNMVRCPAP